MIRKSLFFTFLLLAVSTMSSFGQNPEIVGEWKNGSVGVIEYQNRVTGATKPGRSSVFTYKFLANGSYEFGGYMESTMYNCTTTLFNQITGKYRVDGNTILLTPSRDFWRNGNSCSPNSNRQQTKVPTRKAVEFELRTDEYGAELLCINDGGAESCYRKEKR